MTRGCVFRAGISKTGDQPNWFFFHGREIQNPKTCPERSEVEPAGSKIENGLLLLLSFLGSFFLRSRSGGGSFSLFLLLGDNFRSGGSGFGRSNDWFFFNYGSDNRKRGEIGLHLCRDS